MTDILSKWATYRKTCHTEYEADVLGDEMAKEIERLREATNKDLSARMVACGMIPLEELTEASPITPFMVHSGMTDLVFFGEWLERKAREYKRMQAAHQSRAHVLDDDMFNFILGKGGAFTEALANFRAAK